MGTYGGYGRGAQAPSIATPTKWRGLLAAFFLLSGVVVVGAVTRTFPSDVKQASATGYGCTASGGATLHTFEYSGTAYCTEEFKAGGTWTRPSWVTSAKLMVVGGGGGGCRDYATTAGSGGGGGGVAFGDISVSSATSYTVTVGSGGASCTDGSQSSFVGGSVNWVGGGGKSNYGQTGGAAGSTTKDGSTVSGNAGGTGNWQNSGPPVWSGGGGGGAVGLGSGGDAGTITETFNMTASNNQVVNGYSVTSIRWNTWPIGGAGRQASSDGMLPVARYVGCGGGGAFAVSNWNYQFASRGMSYTNSNCASGGRGAYQDLRNTGSYPSYYYYLWSGGSSWTVYGDNQRIFATPESGNANTGNGGGGAASSDYGSSSGVGGSGGSGVVLIRYEAPVPVNNTAPTISPSSSTWVGTTITRTAGTWTDPLGLPLTITGQWIRYDSVSNVRTDIPGAIGATYVVTADDINYRVMYRETATNGTGTASVFSGATGVVYGVPVFTTNSPPSTAPTGTGFSYTFVASGGGITYSNPSGTLPTGLSLSSAGVLSGTPSAAGSYTFTVRASNAAGTADSPHTIHIGRSATLSTASTTEASGVQFSISPTVTLATGSTPGTGVSVTASVFADPGGTHTLSGTRTQSTNGSGVATWNDLMLTGTAGSYTIRFSASGWPSADLTVTLSPGTSSALAITTQPVGGVLPGVTLGTVPVVRIVDSAGNTVTSSSATITATIASGSANATLSAASVAASAGVATFTGMKVNQAGGNFTVTFAATGHTPVTSSQFTINRTSQTITFSYTGGSKTFTSTDFRVTASTTSQLPVTFSSGTPTVCGVSGDAAAISGSTGAVVSVLGVGTCTIHADQVGDDLFSPATRQSVNITVGQAAQAALSLANATSVDFGNTLKLSTTGGSGTGAVSYALIGGAGTASCSLNSSTNILTFGAAGTCSVQATKAADANYTAQTTSSTLITVNRAAQTVNFTSQVPANPLPGGTYTVSASTSSGLAPTLSILLGGGTVCNISGSSSPATVTFLTSGQCAVMASQIGNGNYLAVATEAEQPIEVGSLNQSITFDALDDRDFGDPSEAISVSATSGLTVMLTNETPTVCSLTGRSVAIVTVGQCTITASQAGNAVYSPAGSVTRSFEISAVVANPPTISSVSAQSGAVAVGFAAPDFEGGVPIVGYRMVAYPTSGGASVTSDGCTTSPCVFEGLTNGTEYTIKLATRNSVGIGAESVASPAVTPATAALAVRDAQASIGDASLTVSWDAPDDFGGGTFVRYELRLRAAGDPWPSSSSYDVFNSASGSHTFTSLTNGTSYEIQIVTITTANAASITGNTTLIVAVPMTVPSAPRLLTAGTHSPREALISWTEPSNNGGASVTSYTVTLDNGATCGTVSIDPTTRSASCRVSSLALGTTYTVTVHANNMMGAGAASTATHTTATFAVPSTGPAGTPPCANCFDDPNDPNDKPVNPTPVKTPSTTKPGSISLSDGVATVTITSADGTSSLVDASGRLVISSTGSALISGSAVLATTIAKSWIAGEAWGTASVSDQGTFTMTVAIPSGTKAGEVAVAVDVVNENGLIRRFSFTLYVVASVPSSGPTATPVCSNCYDDPNDPNDKPTSPTPVKTPSTTKPGSISLSDGVATVTITSAEGITSNVDASGRLVIGSKGSVVISGAGVFATTTAKSWFASTAWGTATVAAGGTFTMTVAIPTDTKTGEAVIAVDVVNENGAYRRFNFALYVIASTPAELPGEGWTGGGKTPSSDPKKPCSGCVSVFPYDPATGKPPTVTSSPAGTSPAKVTISTGSGTTATIGGSTGSGIAGSETTASGGFRVRPPGAIPVVLGGLLPGSTVTVWIGDEFSAQATVGADGTINFLAPIPESLKAGLHSVRIDAVEATGSPVTFLLGIEIDASADSASVGKSSDRALSPLGATAATGLDMSGSLALVLFLEVVGILGLAGVRLRRRQLTSARSM